MQEIFQSKTGFNRILKGEYFHYLEVGTENKNLTSVFCAFDGDSIVEFGGERAPVSELLKNYIVLNGPLYQHTSSMVRNTHAGTNLETLLYAFYHGGASVKAMIGAGIRRVNRNRMELVGDENSEETQLCKKYNVYDYSKSNLRSRESGVQFFGNGALYHDGRSLVLSLKGKRFYTNYDPDLKNILTAMPGYTTGQRGQCRSLLRSVSLAELIFQYYDGTITASNDIHSCVLSTHASLMEKGLEVDHLSDRKSNNYCEMLALMPRKINTSLSLRRTKLKTPFCFFTVHDYSKKQYRVEAGLIGYGYRKYFLFGELSSEAEATEYLKCFNDFYGLAKEAGCAMSKPCDKSLLYYWSTPERMHDSQNPLVQLLNEPEESFSRYEPGAFADMPTI